MPGQAGDWGRCSSLSPGPQWEKRRRAGVASSRGAAPSPRPTPLERRAALDSSPGRPRTARRREPLPSLAGMCRVPEFPRARARAASPSWPARGSRSALPGRLPLLFLHALLWAGVSSWKLTILHTNDMHSRLEQTSDDSGKCMDPPKCVGGVARLHTKVQEIRRAEPNVLLLDAGDQYQGTVWFTVYKGAEVAHFMNALGYDAMVRGRRLSAAGVKSSLLELGTGRELGPAKLGVYCNW